MNIEEINILRALQHLVTTARYNANKEKGYLKISELLDHSDHLINLLCEENVNLDKIKRVMKTVSDQHPECSKSILTNLE